MSSTVEAFQFLDQAVELYVIMQLGGLPFSCSGCNAQEENHCGFVYKEPSEHPVHYSTHTGKEYRHCPLSMIPEIVFQLHDNYEHIQEMGQPKHPDNINALLWWFVKKYKFYKNKHKGGK